MRVESAGGSGSGGGGFTVERRLLEGQLDQHGQAMDKIREQFETFGGATTGGGEEVFLPSGEYGDAASG